MNAYEQKQAQRKERFEVFAGKNHRESESRLDTAHKLAGVIPFGQPMLVDHHSYKSDKSYRNKISTNMGKGLEALDKAKHYERKADGVGSAGISSDDPDAIKKLEAKLARLELSREKSKHLNVLYRKAKSIDEMDITEEEKEELRKQRESDIKFGCWNPSRWRPASTMALSYLGKNIKTVKDRSSTLKASAAMEERPDISCEGFVISESKEHNRIMLCFDGKPEKEIRGILKSNGFRWNRTLVAWTRMLNNNGRYAAKSVKESIEGGV